MNISQFFNGGLIEEINQSTKKIEELEDLIEIEREKIKNHKVAKQITDQLDSLKKSYGEELTVNVILNYLDFEIKDEETEEEEWILKHKPDPNRNYKHGQKGVACKFSNGKERWSFTGFSYTLRKKVYKKLDSRNQACAYAKKVWSGYP
jgi:hypothetical protein